MNYPKGTTHTCEFYGEIQYYRRHENLRVSHAIDDIILDVRWEQWENGQWCDVGEGFSPRRLNKVKTHGKPYSFSV